MRRFKALIGLGLGLGAMLFVGTCQVTVPKKAWAWLWGGAEGKVVETLPCISFADPFPFAGEFTYGPDG